MGNVLCYVQGLRKTNSCNEKSNNREQGFHGIKERNIQGWKFPFTQLWPFTDYLIRNAASG